MKFFTSVFICSFEGVLSSSESKFQLNKVGSKVQKSDDGNIIQGISNNLLDMIESPVPIKKIEDNISNSSPTVNETKKNKKNNGIMNKFLQHRNSKSQVSIGEHLSEDPPAEGEAEAEAEAEGGAEPGAEEGKEGGKEGGAAKMDPFDEAKNACTLKANEDGGCADEQAEAVKVLMALFSGGEVTCAPLEALSKCLNNCLKCADFAENKQLKELNTKIKVKCPAPEAQVCHSSTSQVTLILFLSLFF